MGTRRHPAWHHAPNNRSIHNLQLPIRWASSKWYRHYFKFNFLLSRSENIDEVFMFIQLKVNHMARIMNFSREKKHAHRFPKRNDKQTRKKSGRKEVGNRMNRMGIVCLSQLVERVVLRTEKKRLNPRRRRKKRNARTELISWLFRKCFISRPGLMYKYLFSSHSFIITMDPFQLAAN